MKKCPFCAEEIQDEALKCRYCNEFLDPTLAVPRSQKVQQKVPWYFNNSTLLIGFLCVGPLILPLVWLHPRFDWRIKIVLTIGILLITWWVGKLLTCAVSNIYKYYQLMPTF